MQIGAEETDIFMLVMNNEGMKHLLETKFTLNASAGIAAGPVGRSATARTDATLSSGESGVVAITRCVCWCHSLEAALFKRSG